MLENLARGFLGGCPAPPPPSGSEGNGKYDKTNAKDVERAWNQLVYEIINEGLIDELYDAFAESDKLEDLSPMVQAAAKHIFLT